MSHSQYKPFFILLTLIGILVIGGCTLPFLGEPDADAQADFPDSAPQLAVDSPQAARNAAMLYIRDHHGLFVPLKDEAWVEEMITPEGVVGSSAYQFISGNWSVSVIYPILAPEETIYTVLVTNKGINFTWEGMVDAFGQVSETSSAMDQSIDQLSGEQSQTPTPTATATATPGVTTLTFTDDTYRLALQYPSDWSLTIIPAGRVTPSGGFAAKILQLTNGDYKLLVQYKLLWEITEIGQSIPPGTLEVRGVVNLLGVEIPKHVLIEDGKDKLIFAGDSIDDISYHIRLEDNLTSVGDYDSFAITAATQDEVDQIIASIVRTGDTFPSPTPTLAPSPTSQYDSTKSGVGDGSTVDENCNMANFISHMTVSEGAAMPPGAQFTKTWRLQNIGTCTWTESYSIGFSDGDLMGAEEIVPLTEEVLPGEIGEISVVFTSPEDEGTYVGYWILYDEQGYWFGLGETRRGLIPIEIEVVKPDKIFAYDFAINYCDATWKSFWQIEGVTQSGTLSCPGSTTTEQGFVTLVADPNMEHRLDDELTLWVHPYEQRYGRIQGTFPEFEVQNGDRFKTAIGCMAEMKGCSIDFQLLYKDSNGDTKTLDAWEWFEDYNGAATFIDIDLSFLAGEKVRFILKTVALTHNTDVAHGFWFVPRIDRP